MGNQNESTLCKAVVFCYRPGKTSHVILFSITTPLEALLISPKVTLCRGMSTKKLMMLGVHTLQLQFVVASTWGANC